ncbi:MAG: glycosyltransferase family 4 protein, partial [Agathobacter sp.]|nr:glycosyltransferase family 4 protein [Agathobacter sp.]
MQKKILVITHQLSRTGAPIVLLDMIKIYQKNGYQIEVISMMDGELRIEVEQLQIPVIIMAGFMDRPTAFLEKARSFDLVIANTLLTYEAIHILNGTEMPVIWWLHEGEQYFEYFASVLPDFSGLSPNVHVYSVGHYVQKVIQKRYGILTDILHFGVRDVPESEIKSRDRRKFRFLIVGTYSNVKAQDVLAHAVRRLPDKVMDQAEFYFYGNDENYDKEVYAAVVSLEKDYPNVFMSSLLPHEQLLERMENSDCLIVPSRVDPIPTVAVEMMMKERLCLCT